MDPKNIVLHNCNKDLSEGVGYLKQYIQSGNSTDIKLGLEKIKAIIEFMELFYKNYHKLYEKMELFYKNYHKLYEKNDDHFEQEKSNEDQGINRPYAWHESEENLEKRVCDIVAEFCADYFEIHGQNPCDLRKTLARDGFEKHLRKILKDIIDPKLNKG